MSREPGLAVQTVVVIGGSSGIGLETARRARSEGANVVLAERNPERLKQAECELGALGDAAGPVSSAPKVSVWLQLAGAYCDQNFCSFGLDAP